MDNKIEYLKDELRVFVADIVPYGEARDENLEDRMEELENLVSTYGGIVIVKTFQKRMTPDYNTYIGGGKLDEIIEDMRREKADILIIGNILKAKQIYNINEKLRDIDAKAWDRVDLILKIFERHAKSTEARLQIELAAIRHMGPRIFGMGMELSRQGGGIGTSGIGETNTEIMKRHLRKKIDVIKKKLNQYKKTRAEHRKARIRKNLDTVGIVGYTNAGKSSLLNSITKKGVLAEDKLFATLGTDVGKMYIPSDTGKGKEILLNDTIGFIRDLPPDLIEAFSSTLEDSIESKILLHVIDASDKKLDEKIKIVDDILFQIGATQDKIYVFNKIDLLDKEQLNILKEKYFDLNPVFVSAYSKTGFDKLTDIILKKL
ncbi:MAG: GTPase HflX [Candidatus Gracilibacteria bacterium]|nr:GTPase HflX [Candidatus Gracilibacteria bacterium]